MPVCQPDLEQRELWLILHEEIDRLPAHYRAPLWACYFEGRSYEDVVQVDLCAVPGRYDQRKAVRQRKVCCGDRLGVRRGLGVTAGQFRVPPPGALRAAAVLCACSNPRVDPLSTLRSGNRARNVAVTVLAKGVLKTMLLSKSKMAVAILCLTTAVVAGVGLAARQGNGLSDQRIHETMTSSAGPGSVAAAAQPERPAAPRGAEKLPPGDVVEIAGQIALPGRYSLRKSDTALDVIERAGGLEPGADRRRVRLIRRAGSGETTLIVNYEAIKPAGEMSTSPLRALVAGDWIIVDLSAN